MKPKKKNVIAIILGGGQGSRLYPLTESRSKPAVPIGGKYRLVDIPISNCMNSDIYRIFVLTQFNSASLNASPYFLAALATSLLIFSSYFAIWSSIKTSAR